MKKTFYLFFFTLLCFSASITHASRSFQALSQLKDFPHIRDVIGMIHNHALDLKTIYAREGRKRISGPQAILHFPTEVLSHQVIAREMAELLAKYDVREQNEIRWFLLEFQGVGHPSQKRPYYTTFRKAVSERLPKNKKRQKRGKASRKEVIQGLAKHLKTNFPFDPRQINRASKKPQMVPYMRTDGPASDGIIYHGVANLCLIHCMDIGKVGDKATMNPGVAVREHIERRKETFRRKDPALLTEERQQRAWLEQEAWRDGKTPEDMEISDKGGNLSKIAQSVQKSLGKFWGTDTHLEELRSQVYRLIDREPGQIRDVVTQHMESHPFKIPVTMD